MKKKTRMILIAMFTLLMTLALSVAMVACGKGNTLALQSPVNGAVGVSTLPLIRWKADSKADWYELTISEKEDFSAPAVNESPITETSFQVKSALKSGTKYYMLLKACSESYTAQVKSSFTTKPFEADEDRETEDEKMLFSFDYADQAALDAVWIMHGGGDPITMTLVDSPLENGGKAARLEYDNSSAEGVTRYGWAQAYAKVDDDKYVWAGYGGVKFYLEADGTGTSFRFLFVERVDDYFYADITMSTNYKGYVTIPFSSFKLDTDNSFGGGEMTLDAVKKVEISTIGSNKGGFVVDEISLVKECEDTTYLVEKGEGDTLVYDDFTTYADNAALREVWDAEDTSGSRPSLRTHLGIPTMGVPQGTTKILAEKRASLTYFNALKVTYFTEVGGDLGVASYISGQTPADFSGTLHLEACTDAFKTAILHIGGGKGVELWNLQFKEFPAITYFAKIEFVEDYSAPTLRYTATEDSITIEQVYGAEYSIDGGETWSDSNVFSGLTVGESYEIAIRFKATSDFAASEMATEEVTLTAVVVSDSVFDDFESYADTTALKTVWQTYNAEVSLETENGEKGMKVAFLSDGAQAKKAVSGEWNAYKSISVTYRTSGKGVSFHVTVEMNDYAHYPYKQLTGNGEWQTAIFPFSSLVGDGYAGNGIANLLIKPLAATTWVEIGEIKLLVDERTDIPTVDVDPEPKEDFVINDCDYATNEDIAQAVGDGDILNPDGLTLTADEGGLKVKSNGGWQKIIFVFAPTSGADYGYLQFSVNLTGYKGGKFLIQFDDENYVSYANKPDGSTNYNYNTEGAGLYRIPLSAFTNGDKTAGSAKLIRVHFIINDEDWSYGSVILSDIRLVNADEAATPTASEASEELMISQIGSMQGHSDYQPLFRKSKEKEL